MPPMECHPLSTRTLSHQLRIRAAVRLRQWRSGTRKFSGHRWYTLTVSIPAVGGHFWYTLKFGAVSLNRHPVDAGLLTDRPVRPSESE